MKPLFWIHGNYYDCRKSWKEICDKTGDANIIVLECGYKTDKAGVQPASAADVIMTLKNRDMFDDRPRIIKLQGIPPGYAIISDYLNLVNGNNILVIDGPVGYRAKGAKRMISAASSKFYKTFVKDGKIFGHPIQVKKASEAIAWIKSVATDAGRSIDNEGAALLVEMKGKCLDDLYTEMNKLFSYQNKKKITVDDVRECCVPACLDTTWELVEHLNNRDYEQSMSKLQEYYGQAGLAPSTTFYGDCQRLLGALKKNFMFITMLKDCCGDTLSYNGAKKAIEGLKKKEKKDNSYVWTKNVFDEWWMNMQIRQRGVKSFFLLPQRHLYAIQEDIHRCMFLCRVHSSIESRIKICLDTLVMLICSQISSSNSAACKGWKL